MTFIALIGFGVGSGAGIWGEARLVFIPGQGRLFLGLAALNLTGHLPWLVFLGGTAARYPLEHA